MSMSHLVFAHYDPARQAEVKRLFFGYPHKDHQLGMMGVSKDKMVRYLEASLHQENCQSICLQEGGRLVGLISLKALPWMSEHFGLNMYAIAHLLSEESEGSLVRARLLRYVIEELPEVDFLDCRVAVGDVQGAHALEMCGFRYVGTEIYLGQNLRPRGEPELHPQFEIHTCRECDRGEVLQIAEQTHVHNRFVYDPRINTAAAKSLYRRLISNCFDRDEFHVLVARSRGRVQGFIISKINRSFSEMVGKTCGSLDFIGVRPDARNRGLGVALNDWALHHMVEKGSEFAAVRTLANNYAALATCYRTGFRVTSTSLHFHRWIRRPALATPSWNRRRGASTAQGLSAGHFA